MAGVQRLTGRMQPAKGTVTWLGFHRRLPGAVSL